MALVSCPECGRQISDTAPSCPNCGFRPEPEPALVRVRRKSQINSGILRTDVLINGVGYGGIRSGGTMEIPLDPGRYGIEIVNSSKGQRAGGAHDIRPGEVLDIEISFGVMGNMNVQVS